MSARRQRLIRGGTLPGRSGSLLTVEGLRGKKRKWFSGSRWRSPEPQSVDESISSAWMMNRAKPEWLTMAAYLIGHITIKDSALWQRYTEGVRQSLLPLAAEIVFRGKRASVLAGEHPYNQAVVIKFPDQAALQSWYRSDAYQALIPLRDKAADVVIISYDA
jgi:uncharacterized protein (DUF1330 family)